MTAVSRQLECYNMNYLTGVLLDWTILEVFPDTVIPVSHLVILWASGHVIPHMGCCWVPAALNIRAAGRFWLLGPIWVWPIWVAKLMGLLRAVEHRFAHICPSWLF